ncbi:MAG: restriction endonuclease subunit S [Nitrospiraceae bacterium]|nr:restriction endonuclease subunit S [Nitrospiraceae bacterium]
MSGNGARELPKGWRWARLGEVCEEKTENRNPTATPDESFQYVDITSVDNVLKIIKGVKTLEGKDAPSRARQVILEGDVLISTTRPNLNAVALVPARLHNQICSTGFCVLRPKNILSGEFLFHYVKSPSFVKRLSDLVKGALYPAVTDKQVREQLIPVPPLPEQKRIVSILNEQMEAAERARAATEAQLEIIRKLPSALLRRAFNGEL